MLDDRSRRLLKTLIERYIADGQPVGSRTLSRASGLDLSPATIRNVMSDLEELGLIASPHTSAGRVPTARGYRLFVDNTARLEALKAGEFDLMRFFSAGDWARRVSGKRFDTGELVKTEFKHRLPSGFQSYVLNTRRDQFKDVRVREALGTHYSYASG